MMQLRQYMKYPGHESSILEFGKNRTIRPFSWGQVSATRKGPWLFDLLVLPMPWGLPWGNRKSQRL